MISNYVAIATLITLVLIFFKVPVFASVFLGSVIYFSLNPNVDIVIAAQRITSGMESVSILACPFFIFAGVLFNYCGVTERLVEFCSLVTGRIYGGLAQTNILLSTVMGGMSGSSVADAAMEAKILVPAMNKSGMSNGFSSVITAFSSLITPLIPPGIGMILYGTMAGVSIGKLFTWGLILGICTCASMMWFTKIISKKRGYVPLRNTKLAPGRLKASIKRSFPSLALPVIIIGSIRIGIATPSEAGAIAVAYAIVLGVAYRELNWKKFCQATREAGVTIGMVLIIVGTSSMYSWILTKEQVPQAISAIMLSVISNKYLFLLVINFMLLVVGMFMEGCAATIILAPLLAPIAASYGIDAIHFGMVFTLNLAVGCITPPMGTVMFATCGVTGCSLKEFLSEGKPYFAYMAVLLLLLTYVPFVLPGLY